MEIKPDPQLKTRLLGHLSALARERDPYQARLGHLFVQHYICQEWSQYGSLQSHDFQVNRAIYHNWVLDLPGRQTLPRVIIGAHYDAVPRSAGADDNATGVAVLLELARHLSQDPLCYPVQLVAFDLEEWGLLGSDAFAADLKRQNIPVRLMISLEMLGYCDSSPGSQRYPAFLDRLYPDTGDFIGLIGNWRVIPDLIRLSRAIRQTGVGAQWLPAGSRGRIVPDTRRSDHAPFWDRGYPALMVTDTANLRNPHYHSASDCVDTLDLDFLAGICQGLMLGLHHL